MKTRNLFIILILWCFSSSLYAVTLKYKSLDDLVNEATNIIKGDVTKIETLKIREDHYTIITLSNASIITATQEELTIDIKLRLYGGVVNGIGMAFTGTPQFEVGHTIIAFTKRNGIYSIPIVGWEQGILHVNKNNTITDFKDNKITNIKGKHFEKEIRKPLSNTLLNDKTKQVLINNNKAPAAVKAISKSTLIRHIQARLKKRKLKFNSVQARSAAGDIPLKIITDAEITSDRTHLHTLPTAIPLSEMSDPKHAHKF